MKYRSSLAIECESADYYCIKALSTSINNLKPQFHSVICNYTSHLTLH